MPKSNTHIIMLEKEVNHRTNIISNKVILKWFPLTKEDCKHWSYINFNEPILKILTWENFKTCKDLTPKLIIQNCNSIDQFYEYTLWLPEINNYLDPLAQEKASLLMKTLKTIVIKWLTLPQIKKLERVKFLKLG